MRAVRGWVPAVNADAIVVTVHDDIIMVMVMTMMRGWRPRKAHPVVIALHALTTKVANMALVYMHIAILIINRDTIVRVSRGNERRLQRAFLYVDVVIVSCHGDLLVVAVVVVVVMVVMVALVNSGRESIDPVHRHSARTNPQTPHATLRIALRRIALEELMRPRTR